MKKQFLDAMDFRHACKKFDETKKITDEDMNYILEVARKSPSSFGMEAWKFLVITNQALKEELRKASWNQGQMTSCSHLVVVLAGIESVKPSSGIPEKRFNRRDMPQEKLDMYLGLYASHLEKTLSDDHETYSWTARQAYIASANMMTAAAFEGIDSCPIEGFEKERVETILDLDTTKYQVAMLLPFGYRVEEQSEQLRVPLDEIVEFIE